MLVIAGASGHAGEILQIVLDNQYGDDIYFYDDINNFVEKSIYKRFRIISSLKELINLFQNQKVKYFTLGLGKPAYRKLLYDKFISIGLSPFSTVSKSATINNFNVTLGLCINIMAGVKISNNVTIGNGSLIYYNSVITHDVSVGEFCEISPAVNLLGNCSVGNNTHVGTNATILPHIKIGENSIIAAGSVVTQDVPSNVMVAGVPAAIKKTYN